MGTIPSDLLDEQSAALDRAEQVARMGSWDWAVDEDELVWSTNCFRLFGHAPGSFQPSMERHREQVHPEDLDHFDVRMEAIRGGLETEFEYRILRDGETVHLCANVAVVHDHQGQPRRVVGSVQDVTAQRQVARALAVRVAVSKALATWTDFSGGSASLLAGLGEAVNACFGVFWVPQDAVMAPVTTWSASEHPALSGLRAATLAARPGPGSVTLGQAWQTGRLVVADEPPVAAGRRRQTALREAGVQGVIAVPAAENGVTLAVLEFLSAKPLAATHHLAAALAGAGLEIGYFLSRRSGELVAPALTPRETEVLQLAARAHSAAEIAAELHLSPSTVKRHFEDAYARLSVSDRAAAVGEAMRRGLIG